MTGFFDTSQQQRNDHGRIEKFNGSSGYDTGSITGNFNNRMKIKSWIYFVPSCLILLLLGNNYKIKFDQFNHHSEMQIATETLYQTSVYNNMQQSLHTLNPLGIPYGRAINLPSIRNISDDTVERARIKSMGGKIDSKNKYGGAGDGKHLGGFTELDLQGVSPAVWKHMLQVYGIHSILDVGCGRGTSTSWFALHNCEPVMCVEGSHDAIEQSIFGSIRPQSIVEHDFSRGPWWPEPTFDAVWAVEFLEHVGVNYHYNYITAFRKAAILFVSSSRWGGWHHVEVHGDDWWIRKYESYGFKYDDQLTKEVRAIAKAEANWPSTDNRTIAPNAEKYNGQHIWFSMKVFINPVVAALPQHAHLFPEHGCYQNPGPDGIKSKACGTGSGGELESILPPPYWPLEPTIEQDEAWNKLIGEHMTVRR